MFVVEVHYECKSIQCKQCKGMGHDESKYSKVIVRHEWMPKRVIIGIEEYHKGLQQA